MSTLWRHKLDLQPAMSVVVNDLNESSDGQSQSRLLSSYPWPCTSYVQLLAIPLTYHVFHVFLPSHRIQPSSGIAPAPYAPDDTYIFRSQLKCHLLHESFPEFLQTDVADLLVSNVPCTCTYIWHTQLVPPRQTPHCLFFANRTIWLSGHVLWSCRHPDWHSRAPPLRYVIVLALFPCPVLHAGKSLRRLILLFKGSPVLNTKSVGKSPLAEWISEKGWMMEGRKSQHMTGS